MIDKLMKKYGYKKTYEDRYGVRYEKYHTIFKFTQYIDICHKENMGKIMASYVKGPIKGTYKNGTYKNETCAVEIPVLLLCWIKALMLD